MDYAYDNNGNLIEDYNKGIENIRYNYLNLPERIWFGNGDSITYIYDATGVKLARLISGTETGDRYYIGNMEYNQTQTLEYIHTDEGRIRYNGVDYTYDYYLKDHLGNTRVSFTESTTIPGQAEALQVDNYYPFGMRFNQALILQVEENNYLYNGKELQKNYGLGWYFYGARYYSPADPIFTSVDPWAEKYYSISPYVYVANNPIRSIDPDGRGILDKVIEQGKKAVAQAAYNMVVVVGKSIVQSAQSALENNKLVAKGDVTVSVGAQIAEKAQIDNKSIAGFDANALNVDLIGFEAEADFSSEGISGTVGADYIGKDGEIEGSSGLSAGALAVEGEIGNEYQLQDGTLSYQSFVKGGVGNGAVKYIENSNGENTTSTGFFSSAKFAVIIGVEINASLTVDSKTNVDNDDNDDNGL